ncbi:hypothetical protein P4637_03330 [Halalkalibacterium halodurans]|uniref:hypothetical protein n=1 Tax=Halalkalibacterium halodurans TaxID=86665 RepID=UPI002E23CE7C|nr:hypothetical protein [Halalkalibacterium halodurans]MED4105531.1 hypothetical protein [Halalkalibacterium halodurans]MED4109263.1 hypothetical protein [Halalkalibacterium halodurans]MED4149723.1 hypothetical protein [Halalkalibacterium halodurans]
MSVALEYFLYELEGEPELYEIAKEFLAHRTPVVRYVAKALGMNEKKLSDMICEACEVLELEERGAIPLLMAYVEFLEEEVKVHLEASEIIRAG